MTIIFIWWGANHIHAPVCNSNSRDTNLNCFARLILGIYITSARKLLPETIRTNKKKSTKQKYFVWCVWYVYLPWFGRKPNFPLQSQMKVPYKCDYINVSGIRLIPLKFILLLDCFFLSLSLFHSFPSLSLSLSCVFGFQSSYSYKPMAVLYCLRHSIAWISSSFYKSIFHSKSVYIKQIHYSDGLMKFGAWNATSI